MKTNQMLYGSIKCASISALLLSSSVVMAESTEQTESANEIQMLLNKLRDFVPSDPKAKDVQIPSKISKKNNVPLRASGLPREYEKVDRNQQQTSNTYVQKTPKAQTSSESSNQRIIDNIPIPQLMRSSGAIQASVTEIDSQANSTKLSEMPKNTKFTFKKSIFFPAHRGAVVYVDGKFAYTVMENVKDLNVVQAKKSSETSLSCALTSNKSYLLLRGKDRPERKESFLTVSGVKLFQGKLLNKDRTTFEINFMPKMATEEQIIFKINCVLPTRITDPSDLKKLDLDIIEQGFKDVFEFQLPRYTEV
ncbi:MAG: hypothetical protein HAW67_04225 [Endozoicomonadaceae bacterium]|nr:hypothetical protein [Endozoicomonadaceae bacterium]